MQRLRIFIAWFASQSSRLGSHRELPAVRFSSMGQSAIIPPLPLSKWKQRFHFEKDVSPESAGIRASANTRHSGE